jgi:hypothetical protein
MVRLLFVTATAMLAIPYVAYTFGVPADDEISQSYVQTVNGIKHHVQTYSVSDSYQYEKVEILGTLDNGVLIAGHFVVTLPQRIHK